MKGISEAVRWKRRERRGATGNTVVDARCGEARRDEAEEGRGGSGLGHGTGLLVIDVAADTSSVHAWKNHGVQQGAGLSRGRGGSLLGREQKAQQKQERLHNISLCLWFKKRDGIIVNSASAAEVQRPGQMTFC